MGGSLRYRVRGWKNEVEDVVKVTAEKAPPILQLGTFVQAPPGSLLVVPPACIILEQGFKKQQTIGLRVSFMDVTKKNEYSGFINCIAQYDDKFSQLPAMHKVVQAFVGLANLPKQSGPAGSRDGTMAAPVQSDDQR
eukprot:9486847-Pyramimonas_sp.AAC.2